MGKKKGGWWNERARHGLAAKGIKTKQVSKGLHRVIDADRKAELQKGIKVAEQSGDTETEKDLKGILKRESDVVEVIVEKEVPEAPNPDPEKEKEEKKDKKKSGLRW